MSGLWSLVPNLEGVDMREQTRDEILNLVLGLKRPPNHGLYLVCIQAPQAPQAPPSPQAPQAPQSYK